MGSVFKQVQKVYQAIMPDKLRKDINVWRDQQDRKSLRNKVLSYYSGKEDTMSHEEKEVVDFLKTNEYSVFPYNFINDYKVEDVDVHFDSDKQMYYSFVDGKRLYIKRGATEAYIGKKLNAARLEQDPKSPHLYLENDFQVNDGDVIVDIGVQEGNFALGVIEKVSKVYLFEADDDWIEALEATFEPWKEKVVIINSFVSDNNEGNNISLDKYFEHLDFNFLKIDVDGAEQKLINGAAEVLKRESIKLALCTYHFQDDGVSFTKQLKKLGFNTAYSSGFMLFHFDKKQKPPYLRRGLIRAKK